MQRNGRVFRISQFEIALILALLFGCRENQSASGKPTLRANAEDSTVVALIFCDLTASVDSAAIEKVARDVYKLMLSLTYETELYILPIDKSPFVKNILKFTYPKRATKFSEIGENKKIVRTTASHVYHLIKKLYREEFSRADLRAKPLSCLLESLQTADRYFSQFRSDQGRKFVFELIYFSDMIEECANSPIGSIFLTKANYPAALNSLKKYRPDFNLSYANVSIIISLDMRGEDSSYISSNQLREFWETVFLKAGFTAEQIRNSIFLADLPRRFEGRNSPWK